MSINHHKLYLNNVFALAGTLVVKSKYSAERINNRLTALYGASAVDSNQPATWKYYLNICGNYHPTDPQITIRSLDTLQLIAFTKTNLLTHTATARAYQYGSRYYRELLAQYPDHENLILGILYPANMSQVLDAPDFSVVAYPSHLVEPNEESLIRNINTWLEKFYHRWNVSAFHLTDELYGASLLGVMYSQLTPLILTLRQRACKTPEVHSYHVRQYLASHGMLDVYLSQMTQKQALFFYRNINYIERHSGKVSTFEWLTEKVLTDRGLPLVEYEMRHETTDMPEELTPKVVFSTNPLNRIGSKSTTGISTTAIMAKEIAVASGNFERIAISSSSTERNLKYSLQGKVKTKVLESSLVQNADSSTQSIQETALSLWGYMAATGRYAIYTRVKNPITGEELTLSMLQAYHYFFYAYCMVHARPLETVPLVYAQFVPRIPAPTLSEVLNHVDTGYVSEEKIIELMSLNPNITSFVNTEMFKEGCQQVFSSINQQATMVAQEEHFYARGLMHGAFAKQYSDYLLTTSETGENIKAYFSSIDIPTTGFSDLEWQQIYLDLFQSCTGFDMQAAIQTSDLQKAMVRLMTQLSSYSVQFVSELSGSSIRSLNWAAIRLGDNSGASRSYFEIITNMFEIFKLKSDVHMYVPVPVLPTSNGFSFKTPNYHLGMLEIPVDISTDSNNNSARHEVIVHIAGVDLDDRFDPNASTEIPSWEAFRTMTDAEIAQIPDIYTWECRQPPIVPTKININDVVHNNALSSFTKLSKPSVVLPSWKAYWGPKNMRYFSDENSVIVLEGIWYYGGQNQIESFMPTIGRSLVDSFTYAGGTDVNVTIGYYDYTGGPLKTVSFAPGYTPGDMDIGVIGQLPQSIELQLTNGVNIFESITFNNTKVDYADIVMVPFHNTYQFQFSYKSDNYDVGALINTASTPVLAFYEMAPRLVLAPFLSQYQSVDLTFFTGDVNVYHLLPLYQLFIADGPTLQGWGAIDMDVTPIDPVPANQPPLDEGVVFTTTGPAAIDGVDFTLSGPSVIDFDFEATMATLPP